MKVLISFDIDGCLENGDPPGPITLDMVRKAQAKGAIIGSCSDRAPSAQRTLWERAGIEYDFVTPKYGLAEIKEKFPADKYIHTGDRNLDEQFARQAGYDFYWEHEGAEEPWLQYLDE